MTKEEYDAWWAEELEAECSCDDQAQIWHEKGYSWPDGKKLLTHEEWLEIWKNNPLSVKEK